MQIVIEIDENLYTRLFDNGGDDYDYAVDMATAIRKGTPLPEHHGRLGDLDALEEYFKGVRKQLKASDYKDGTEFFVRDEMLLNFQQFIHLCDAIIEGSDSEWNL